MITTKSKIVQSLRKLWLQSKERSSALKRDNYTCQSCNRKQSRAKGKEFKVQVHHDSGRIDWDKLVGYIRQELLVPHEELETLCKECHDTLHKESK